MMPSPVITGQEFAGYVALRNRHSYKFEEPTIGQLYDYLFTADGIYLRAVRTGLSVLLKIHDCEIRGLARMEDLQPDRDALDFTLPRVPVVYLEKMLELSIETCVNKNSAVEALFHLRWIHGENRWRLDKPAQEATGASVKPIHAGPGSSYDLALIELHSHHQMAAFFSATDNEEEQGFRIYAVIGEIFSRPAIRVRVGCFGHFQEIPPKTVFELPRTISDDHEEESLVETS